MSLYGDATPQGGVVPMTNETQSEPSHTQQLGRAYHLVSTPIHCREDDCNGTAVPVEVKGTLGHECTKCHSFYNAAGEPITHPART